VLVKIRNVDQALLKRKYAPERRVFPDHLQTPSEIFSDLDWQKQFDGALARTGVGLDTNSDRKAYTALGPICVSAGFLGRGPGKPGYTL
jgi:hypothetical protein